MVKIVKRSLSNKAKRRRVSWHRNVKICLTGILGNYWAYFIGRKQPKLNKVNKYVLSKENREKALEKVCQTVIVYSIKSFYLQSKILNEMLET